MEVVEFDENTVSVSKLIDIESTEEEMFDEGITRYNIK